MRAAVLYGKEDVRVEERPTPSLKAGEVLIRVKAALTCGTDLKVFRNGSHAKMLIPPALFGHEFSGVIESVGAGVAPWKPGDRVVAANSAPCLACFFCKKGKPNLCKDLLFVNGAYAEFLRLPKRIVDLNLLRIPEGLSFEAAALTEPLACVARGVEAVNPKPGENVVVLGAGPVGLLFIQLLSRAGARVTVVGKGEKRLAAAKRFGAENLVDISQGPPMPEGEGADCVIEAVGRPAAWSRAIQMVRPGGRVLLFGGCPSGTEVALDTKRFHYDELTLLSVFHHTPEAIRRSLHLISDGKVDPKLLITKEARLDELPAILKGMLTEQDGVKMVIRP